MLRPLVIDDAVKARVREILDFAASHYYYPGQSEVIPGDDPRFTVNLLSYRAVFSFTVGPEGHLFRHLSVSVPGKNFPNPSAFYTIAELFGFSGWDGKSVKPPAGWALDINKQERCIVVVQPLLPFG